MNQHEEEWESLRKKVMIEIDNMVTDSSIENLADVINGISLDELMKKAHEEEVFSLGYASYISIWIFFFIVTWINLS